MTTHFTRVHCRALCYHHPMHTAPRFSMETIDDATDLPDVKVLSPSEEYSKALQDFRYAWLNIHTLGASMRAHSSFTTHAVEALVTLLIAKQRLHGTASHPDAKKILTENSVPEEIQQLLLERLDETLLHRLALESQKTATNESSPALQQKVFEKICATFNSRN